jgi:hypothetical protein
MTTTTFKDLEEAADAVKAARPLPTLAVANVNITDVLQYQPEKVIVRHVHRPGGLRAKVLWSEHTKKKTMTISGVCRYSPGGNWVGQFPYGQGAAAAAAAVAEEEKNKEEEGQQQEATSDTSSTDYIEGDYQL